MVILADRYIGHLIWSGAYLGPNEHEHANTGHSSDETCLKKKRSKWRSGNLKVETMSKEMGREEKKEKTEDRYRVTLKKERENVNLPLMCVSPPCILAAFSPLFSRYCSVSCW